MDRIKLKVGRIGYLNVLPVYYPLEHGYLSHNFSFVYGSPAELNEAIRKGKLHLSVVSSIEYARHHERYLILPDLSISARGKVKSVLLLSRISLKHCSSSSVVHTTPQSHASVALADILLREIFELECNFVTCARPLWQTKRYSPDSPEIYLAIGDEALYWAKKGFFPHVYDLGELWTQWTGKPFVFALWVCRKEVAKRFKKLVTKGARLLTNAKRLGLENLDEAIKQAARTSFLTSSELKDYFSTLSYRLGDDEIDGLLLYFAYLGKHGIITKIPPVQILNIGRGDGRERYKYTNEKVFQGEFGKNGHIPA